MHGIYAPGQGATGDLQIADMQTSGNAASGLYVGNALIVRCQASGNGIDGINAVSSVVSESTAIGNRSIGFNLSDSTLQHSVSIYNESGVAMSGGSATNNTVHSNQEYGFLFGAISPLHFAVSVFGGNAIYDNAAGDVYMDLGSYAFSQKNNACSNGLC